MASNNIITVLQRQHGYDTQKAMDENAVRCSTLWQQFCQRLDTFRQGGQAEVMEYIGGLMAWMVGNDL